METTALIGAFLLCAAQTAGATDQSKNSELLEQLDFNGDHKLQKVEILVGLMNETFSPNYQLSEVEKLGFTLAKQHKELTLTDIGMGGDGSKAYDLSHVWNNYYTLEYLRGKNKTEGVYFDFNDIDASKLRLKTVKNVATSPDLPVLVPGFGNPALGPGAQQLRFDNSQPPKIPVSPGYVRQGTFVKVYRSIADLTPGISGTTQPAYFSFSRNDATSVNSLLLQGVIATSIPFENVLLKDPFPMSFYNLEGFSLLPSVSFDKATNQTPSTSNVDTLDYNLGLSTFWEPNASNATGFAGAVTATFTYATDFEMKSEIPSVQLDIVPIKSQISLGGDTDLFGIKQILVSTLLDFHVEGGEVIDRGANTALRNDTGYLRGGPEVGFTFTPDDDRPRDLGILQFRPSDLSANVTYLYYARALGLDGDAHMLTTSLSWAVGGSKNPFSLKIEYDNGVTPIQLQDKHLLTIGVGIKYP